MSARVTTDPLVSRDAGAPARPLISVADVAKTYRTRDGDVESLRPLSFDIGAGEFLAIVGPSGCGKSTLLKMIGGLLSASRGRIAVNGRDVRQKDVALLSVIGVRDAVREAQIFTARTFNYSSLVAAAILFLLATIPLARLTDHLQRRDRARRLQGVL